MLENHFANGLSLERGFQAFHGSEGSFETRLDPCIEAKPMDNPALSLLLVQQSTQRKREIPCGVSSGESTRPCTHRRLSNEGEREGVRERERGGIGAFSTTLPLPLSRLISDKDSIGFREWNFSNCKRQGSRRNTVLIGFHWLDRLFNRAAINYSVAHPLEFHGRNPYDVDSEDKFETIRDKEKRNWKKISLDSSPSSIIHCVCNK